MLIKGPPIFIAQRDQRKGRSGVKPKLPRIDFSSRCRLCRRRNLESLRNRIVWTGSNDDLVASGRDDTTPPRTRVILHVIRTIRILIVGVGIADEVNGTVCSQIHTYCRMLFVFLVPQFY